MRTRETRLKDEEWLPDGRFAKLSLPRHAEVAPEALWGLHIVVLLAAHGGGGQPPTIGVQSRV
jgi:hypothetical protein